MIGAPTFSPPFANPLHTLQTRQHSYIMDATIANTNTNLLDDSNLPTYPAGSSWHELPHPVRIPSRPDYEYAWDYITEAVMSVIPEIDPDIWLSYPLSDELEIGGITYFLIMQQNINCFADFFCNIYAVPLGEERKNYVLDRLKMVYRSAEILPAQRELMRNNFDKWMATEAYFLWSMRSAEAHGYDLDLDDDGIPTTQFVNRNGDIIPFAQMNFLEYFGQWDADHQHQTLQIRSAAREELERRYGIREIDNHEKALRAIVNDLEEVTLDSLAEDSRQCSICLEEYGLHNKDADSTEANGVDNTPVKTKCGHIFCRDCLYYSILHSSARCPMCRGDLQLPVPGLRC
jgi:hypothetical protein